jgi:hypothetical protein
MSGKEYDNSAKQPILELVMPSLPELYDGVFEDVYVDYLENPEMFRTAFMYRLENDNPALIPLFSSDLMFDEEEISLKWPMIYYEMFARSSRRVGLPPLFVPETRSIHEVKKRILEIENVLESPELTEGFVSRHQNSSFEREERDRLSSSELNKFWNIVGSDIQSRINSGSTDSELFLYLANLYILQEILQKQHDEYKLTGEFLRDSS